MRKEQSFADASTGKFFKGETRQNAVTRTANKIKIGNSSLGRVKLIIFRGTLDMRGRMTEQGIVIHFLRCMSEYIFLEILVGTSASLPFQRVVDKYFKNLTNVSRNKIFYILGIKYSMRFFPGTRGIKIKF